MRNVEH